MAESAAAIERGRAAFTHAAWREAFAALSDADRANGLSARDLGALAQAANMLGDTDAYVDALERAHRAHLEAGEVLPAVRVGFWIGHSLLFRGQGSAARGWFARAQRLFDEVDDDGSERGWLLIPAWLRQMAEGDYAGGYDTAGSAANIARRFGDTDLLWLARGDQGRALINMGGRWASTGRRDVRGRHRGPALPGCRRHRLLQHDRLLRRRVRVRPRSRMDRCAEPLV